MSEITGKDRIRAAFKREFADRVPFYPQFGHFNAQLLPCTIREYLTDSDKFAEAQIKAYEMFKPDVVLILVDLLMEAEDLGAKVRYPEDSMCLITEPPIQEKSDLDRLDVPDPLSAKRMRFFIDACRRICQEVKDSSVGSVIPGPWTTAIDLRDPSFLLRDCMKDPPFVHALMKFSYEVVMKFALAVRDTGAGISLSEAPASCSLISPKIYREFVFPYHRKMVEELKSHKIGLTIHVCGYADPILEDLINTGANSISIDAPSNLEEMMRLAKGKSVIIGNVDTKFFYTGSREDMEAAIRRCIEIGASESGFILSSGCEVPGLGTVERVRWFFEAAEKYGRYS